MMTSASQPTPLEARLKRQIAATGPISVAAYMAQCLADPNHGYYTSNRPIGKDGDFITAPEVSQMFGELIAIFMLSVWQQAGSPIPFNLVELGPGRGTLMRDMVRAISSDPKAKAALHIHLVEIGDKLKAQQSKVLSDCEAPINWHQNIETLPDEPIFIVGNEFFDCLPIHQWVYHKGKWHQRVVGLNEEEQLAFGLGAVQDLSRTDHALEDGTIWETSPASEAIIETITRQIAKNGGAALFLDYGYIAPGFGDTLQAMRHHAFADPLSAPGKQDITAHVNFAKLRDCAKSCSAEHLRIPSPVNQGDFLLSMGLLERAGQLGSGKSHTEQEAIRNAVERLAGPDQMGELFKVLALLPKEVSVPPFQES